MPFRLILAILLTTGVVATNRIGVGFIRQPGGPLPFNLNSLQHHRQRRGGKSSILRSIDNRVRLSSKTNDDDGSGLEISQSRGNAMELWLDLRGTALFPKAAMDYLCENVDGVTPEAIDRVIMSEEAFEKLLVKEENQNSGETTILYVPSHGDDLVMSSATAQQSFPCGKVIRSQEGLLFNPILALDIVMANGGWILVEQGPETYDKGWLEEVGSLVTFLMSSSSSSISGSLGMSDPDLSLAKNGELEKKYATPAGNGVAIACTTANSLMEVSKVILTQTSLPTGTTTSAGGILLPSSSSSGSDLKSLEIVQQIGTQVDDDQLPVAVVLPLDIQLWKTAMYLISDCELEEGDESSDSDEGLR